MALDRRDFELRLLRFRMRVLQDALSAASRDQWIERAAVWDWVAGDETDPELVARCAARKAACLAKAELCEEDARAMLLEFVEAARLDLMNAGEVESGRPGDVQPERRAGGAGVLPDVEGGAGP